MGFKNSLVLKGSFVLTIALSAAARAEDHGGAPTEAQAQGEVDKTPRVRCPVGVRCMPRPWDNSRFHSIDGEEATALREILDEAGAKAEEMRLSKTSQVRVSDGTICQGEGQKLVCELHDSNGGGTLRLEGDLLRRWRDIIKKYAKDGALPKVVCSRETVQVPYYQGDKARYPMKMVSATRDHCEVTLPEPYKLM